MSTTALPQAVPQQRHTWTDYLDALAERDRLGRRYRITFDQGRLEIMPISSQHEGFKGLLRMLLEAFCEELAISILAMGAFTCKREQVQRGLEPDECYYIRHYDQVRGRLDIDLETDPPPDLALEVEVSRSVVDRLVIYAALNVPEVWRFDGHSLSIWVLRQGRHVESQTSLMLPNFPVVECMAHLARWPQMTQVEWLRSWRQWLRANVVPQGS